MSWWGKKKPPEQANVSTVKELRDYLDQLVDGGYGHASLWTSTYKIERAQLIDFMGLTPNLNLLKRKP